MEPEACLKFDPVTTVDRTIIDRLRATGAEFPWSGRPLHRRRRGRHGKPAGHRRRMLGVLVAGASTSVGGGYRGGRGGGEGASVVATPGGVPAVAQVLAPQTA
jgi:hypothetical protein